jgi:hypothetical protein
MPCLTINTASRTPRPFTYATWDDQLLHSTREFPLAFDVETEWNTDELKIPHLALAVASDGRTHVAIHADRLAAFLLAHRKSFFVGHNVQFDFWVVDQHLAGQEEARRVLWDVCNEGRLRDTQILDMLLQLGTGRLRKVGSKHSGKGKGKKRKDGSAFSRHAAEGDRRAQGDA